MQHPKSVIDSQKRKTRVGLGDIKPNSSKGLKKNKKIGRSNLLQIKSSLVQFDFFFMSHNLKYGPTK
jgi:hypothetical protein